MFIQSTFVLLLLRTAVGLAIAAGQPALAERLVATFEAQDVERPFPVDGLRLRSFHLSCTLPGVVWFYQSPSDVGPLSESGIVFTEFGTVRLSLRRLNAGGGRANDPKSTRPAVAEFGVPGWANHRPAMEGFPSDLALMRWLLELKAKDVGTVEEPRRALAEAAFTNPAFDRGSWLIVEGSSATAVFVIDRVWYEREAVRGYQKLSGVLFDEHGTAQMTMGISAGSHLDPVRFNLFLSKMIGSARFSGDPNGVPAKERTWIGIDNLDEEMVLARLVKTWQAREVPSIHRGPEEARVEDVDARPRGIVLEHGGLAWRLRDEQSAEQSEVNPFLNIMSSSLRMESGRCRIAFIPRGEGASASSFRLHGADSLATRIERLHDPAKTDLENALRMWRLTPGEVAAAHGERRRDLATAFLLFRVDARTPEYVFYGKRATVAVFGEREASEMNLRLAGFRPSLRCVVFDASGRERVVVRFVGEGVSEAGLLDLAKQLAAHADWAE